MSPQMPSVAQYTLPPPKKSAVQTPESNAPSQTSTQTTGGIPPVAQFSLPPSKNKPTVSPDDTSLLGKVKNFAEGALPTIGAIGGGILGGIGGGLVTAPSVFGIPAGAFAGGVAGAGAGGAAGEALKEKLQGQNLNAPAIAATGLLSAGGEAVGGPLAAGIGKLAGVTGEALYKNIGALGTAAKYAEGAKNQIIDALTPRLTGKAYQTAAKQGTVSSPGLLGGAGIEGAALKDVQSAYDGVESAAKALGTKVNQIVKPGLGYATRNINKVNQTIRNYAQNIVKPFYENIAKEPSLDDFITAIQQTRPPKNLSRAALQAWNQMKEDTINTVSSHLKGEQTGITSLSQLRKIAPEGSVPEKAPGNFWDARKIIDDVYDTATKGKAFTDESLVGAKAGYKSLRDTFKQLLSDSFRYPGQMDKVNAVHEFLRQPQVMAMNKTGWDIATLEKQFGLTPNPKSVANADEWDAMMNTLSGLYKARDLLSTKVGIERGMTGLEGIAARHPVAVKTAKIAGEGLAGLTGLNVLKNQVQGILNP